jgi:hypothetical protein
VYVAELLVIVPRAFANTRVNLLDRFDRTVRRTLQVYCNGVVFFLQAVNSMPPLSLGPIFRVGLGSAADCAHRRVGQEVADTRRRDNFEHEGVHSQSVRGKLVDILLNLGVNQKPYLNLLSHGFFLPSHLVPFWGTSLPFAANDALLLDAHIPALRVKHESDKKNSCGAFCYDISLYRFISKLALPRGACMFCGNIGISLYIHLAMFLALRRRVQECAFSCTRKACAPRSAPPRGTYFARPVHR